MVSENGPRPPEGIAAVAGQAEASQGEGKGEEQGQAQGEVAPLALKGAALQYHCPVNTRTETLYVCCDRLFRRRASRGGFFLVY